MAAYYDDHKNPNTVRIVFVHDFVFLVVIKLKTLFKYIFIKFQAFRICKGIFVFHILSVNDFFHSNLHFFAINCIRNISYFFNNGRHMTRTAVVANTGAY